MAYKPRRYHFSKTFFERLGSDQIERNITEKPNIKATIDSIKHNLNNILNSRIGQAPSAPDLGLRDFNDATSSRNEAFGIGIQKEIRKCVLKYEPRVKEVQVILESDLYYPTRLNIRLQLTIEIEDESHIVLVEVFYDDKHYSVLQ